MLRTSVLRFARAPRALAASHAASAGSGSNHLPTAQRLRQSTGITGLDVHPAPLPTLAGVYEATLNLLKALPETSVYRQSAEAVTRQRLSVVQRHLSGAAGAAKGENSDELAIEAVEEELDSGLIEEVLKQAKDEEGLAGKMIEWKR